MIPDDADSWFTDTDSVNIDTTGQADEGNNRLHLAPNTVNSHASANAVAVDPATTYVLSSYVKVTSGSGEFGGYISEYDADWNWVSGQWMGAFYEATEGTWVFHYTPTSMNVVYAEVEFYTSGNSTFEVFLDSVTMAPTTLSNLIPNGGFEALLGSLASGWSTPNDSVSIDTTGQGDEGNNSLHFAPSTVTTHAFADAVPVDPATIYTLSQYIKVTSGTGEFGCYISEYAADWNWVSGQWMGAFYETTEGTWAFNYTPTSTNVVYAEVEFYTTGKSTFDIFLDSVTMIGNQ